MVGRGLSHRRLEVDGLSSRVIRSVVPRRYANFGREAVGDLGNIT